MENNFNIPVPGSEAYHMPWTDSFVDFVRDSQEIVGHFDAKEILNDMVNPPVIFTAPLTPEPPAAMQTRVSTNVGTTTVDFEIPIAPSDGTIEPGNDIPTGVPSRSRQTRNRGSTS